MCNPRQPLLTNEFPHWKEAWKQGKLASSAGERFTVSEGTVMNLIRGVLASLFVILPILSACGVVPADKNALLTEAARRGDFYRVKILLDQGADPGTKAKNGGTILMAAAFRDDAEAAEVFLGKGIDVNPRTVDGWTALMVVCHSGYVDVARLLLEHGADVNLRHRNGKTALDWAVSRGHWEVKKLLREHGATE